MAIPLGITSFPTYGTCIPYGTCGDLERKPPDVVNKLMGRKLTPTPEHLTRAIYVPYHRHNTTHLPFYNVTKAYKASVGNAPVGGCEFKTRLCLMRKPTRNTVDVDVRFLINVNDEDNCVTVQERCLGAGHEANMPLSQDPDDDFTIVTPSEGTEYSVNISYPLPAKASKNTIIEYPYFALSSQDEKEISTFEWQIHPIEQGGLCYTLIDSRLLSKTDCREDAIRAIYHHAGMEDDLPGRYSEGILLLPEAWGTAEDAVIVASLYGMLHKVRSRKQAQMCNKSKMSRLRKAFSKYSMRRAATQAV